MTPKSKQMPTLFQIKFCVEEIFSQAITQYLHLVKIYNKENVKMNTISMAFYPDSRKNIATINKKSKILI